MEKFNKGWDGFLELCLSAHNDKALSLFFNLLMTAEERDDIAMRYLIIQELLKEEKTQRQIAQSLGVSIAKITRGSNELKRIDKKLLVYLKELIAK